MFDSIVIVCAKYLIYVVIVAAAVCWLRLSRANKIAYSQVGVLGGVVAFLISLVAAAMYFDPRPFTHPGIVALIPHAANNGFPSDHTLLAAVLAFSTLLYSRKIGTAMLVATVLIGGSRVIAHVHSPIDIIGSIVIALASVAAVRYARNAWLSRRSQAQPTTKA